MGFPTEWSSHGRPGPCDAMLIPKGTLALLSLLLPVLMRLSVSWQRGQPQGGRRRRARQGKGHSLAPSPHFALTHPGSARVRRHKAERGGARRWGRQPRRGSVLPGGGLVFDDVWTARPPRGKCLPSAVIHGSVCQPPSRVDRNKDTISQLQGGRGEAQTSSLKRSQASERECPPHQHPLGCGGCLW